MDEVIYESSSVAHLDAHGHVAHGSSWWRDSGAVLVGSSELWGCLGALRGEGFGGHGASPDALGYKTWELRGKYLCVLLHTHTHTHTQTHTQTHTHIHTHTHTHTLTHTHEHIHTFTHTHIHTHIHTYTQLHKHTYTHTHVHT